jgi:hypothetical protein
MGIMPCFNNAGPTDRNCFRVIQCSDSRRASYNAHTEKLTRIRVIRSTATLAAHRLEQLWLPYILEQI